MGERWVRVWPSLLALVTLPAVGGPAAVASYRHARDVIAEHGDPVMAPWLALTTDGMPGPASGRGSGTDPAHVASGNGHDGPVRAGRVPDGVILAWLREQACTTGRVPGRRKMIDKWGLGSTRAERLRRIVRDEAGHDAAVSAG
jgi:hypothetical protein